MSLDSTRLLVRYDDVTAHPQIKKRVSCVNALLDVTERAWTITDAGGWCRPFKGEGATLEEALVNFGIEAEKFQLKLEKLKKKRI